MDDQQLFLSCLTVKPQTAAAILNKVNKKLGLSKSNGLSILAVVTMLRSLVESDKAIKGFISKNDDRLGGDYQLGVWSLNHTAIVPTPHES